ncbi:MAG: hypothetical protein WAV20_15850 [Blastocatellia bacterium]
MKFAEVALALGLLIGLAVLHMVNTDAATSSQADQTNKSSDKYLGPIVDYDLDNQAAAIGDPKERSLREVRGRRYNQRAPDPLGDLPTNWEGFGISNHWYIGLPAIPVAQSDVVVVGEVVANEAHLSNDKTGVYSEFSITVDEVLKTHLESPLKEGDVTIGEREGRRC